MSCAATWMDLEMVIVSEASQTEKDRCNTGLLTCRIWEKGTNELIYKTELELQMMQKTYLLLSGVIKSINWEIGMDI